MSRLQGISITGQRVLTWVHQHSFGSGDLIQSRQREIAGQVPMKRWGGDSVLEGGAIWLSSIC
jgi:hypothetical protein